MHCIREAFQLVHICFIPVTFQQQYIAALPLSRKRLRPGDLVARHRTGLYHKASQLPGIALSLLLAGLPRILRNADRQAFVFVFVSNRRAADNIPHHCCIGRHTSDMQDYILAILHPCHQNTSSPVWIFIA